MNELEKKLHDVICNEIQWSSATEEEEFEDLAKATAKIALEEIKAAFNAGMDFGDGHNHYPDLEKYLKQKGYECDGIKYTEQERDEFAKQLRSKLLCANGGPMRCRKCCDSCAEIYKRREHEYETIAKKKRL